MSRSLISTATAICMGSLLLLGCQPTDTVSSGGSGPSTTIRANGEGDGDGNEGDNNGGHGGGRGGSDTAVMDTSCPALRSAGERLEDLSMLLGNLTQPVLDQARAGDAGGLDPRTLGKTLGVIQPLGAKSSEMASSLAALGPIFDLLQTSLQPDVALDPTALDQLRAGGGVVAAAAEKLQDTVKEKCPRVPETAPTTTVAADPVTTVPADPATTVAADPAATVPADPTTTVAVDPATTVPVDPTTTVPADPTTTLA